MQNLGNSVFLLSVVLNILLVALYSRNRDALAKTERTLEYEQNKISQLENTIKALNSAMDTINNPASYQLLQDKYDRSKLKE